MSHRRPGRALALAFLLAPLLTLPARAQSGPIVLSAEGKEALRPYRALLGTWEGPAKFTVAGGRVLDVRQFEAVREGAGGAALVVEGRGTMATPQGEREVHNALGVIWWDAAARELRMRAWLADGRWVDATPTVEGSTLRWGHRDQTGTETRYTVTGLAEGVWREVGERRAPGGEWTRFTELELRRKP